MKTEKEIVALWKALDIERAEFEFYCGGDSMGDTTITLYDTKGKTVVSQEISDYIDDEIYDKVEFYEASDGHYQGESGTVYIEVDDDGESLYYNKSSTSEWSENLTSEVEIELGEEAASFVRSKLTNINGSQDGIAVNYKADFILTDREEELLQVVEETISDFLQSYEPEQSEGELDEWYTFESVEDKGEILFNGNAVKLEVSNQVTVFREGDD